MATVENQPYQYPSWTLLIPSFTLIQPLCQYIPAFSDSTRGQLKCLDPRKTTFTWKKNQSTKSQAISQQIAPHFGTPSRLFEMEN